MAILHEEALPYYEQGTAGTFTGAAGVTIAYQAFTHGARDAIVLAPGRTEGSHTFMQLAYELRDQPYDLYVIDHRGQGLSGRLTADPRKGHVDKFDNYIADYAQLVDQIVTPAGYEHLYAVGHSMGGAITLAYTQQHPETFDSIALSAPMLEIKSPIGEGALLDYASNVDPEATIPAADVAGILTNDPVQLELLYETDRIFPDRSVGAATYGWVAESIKATRVIRTTSLDTPVVLFQAQADDIVVPASQTAFCELARNCELVPYVHARHELLFAEAPVRDDLIARMLARFTE
jgi:lysophospholipase